MTAALRPVVSCLVLAAAACSDPFESPSSVTGVRVLAVQLDAPFARPGEPVSMRMLAHDGAASPLENRLPAVTWFAGCEDPDDDAPSVCHQRLAWIRSLGPDELAGGAIASGKLPEGARVGTGLAFTYTPPSDIVSRHRTPATETIPRGLAYVFFAACGGRLVPSPDERPAAGIPVACVDRESGKPLGASRFVTGYVPIRVYEELVNHNPSLGDTLVGGRSASGSACDGGGACPAGEACSAGRCVLALARCDESSREDCPEIPVLPTVLDSSFETDEAGASPGVPTSGETLWAAYYASAGELDAPTRMLFDPTDGRASAGDAQGVFRVPSGFAGPARLWAVVHDTRGGVAWTQTDVVIR